MSTNIVDVIQEYFYESDMISPEQSRAARAWLDWSQEDLAKKAQVSLSTVRDFEKGRRIPIKNNLDAMRTSFEAAGIELLWADGEPFGIGRTQAGPLARTRPSSAS